MLKKHSKTFKAYDNNRQEFTILEYTYFNKTQSVSDTNILNGLKDLRTSDGDEVIRIKKGFYRIIGYKKIEVYSDDPNAS